jgi:hypothetical protein
LEYFIIKGKKRIITQAVRKLGFPDFSLVIPGISFLAPYNPREGKKSASAVLGLG